MGLKINRNELNIEHALGAGGEGTVYDLPKDYSIRGLQGPFVYKEYLLNRMEKQLLFKLH